MDTTPPDGPEPFPFPVTPVPPELLAWARQTFDLEAFLEEVRETEATGGHTLESFIAEIEAAVRES